MNDNNGAAVQTAITENIGSAFAGQWYDISDTDAVSASVEASGMPFGVAAVKGTNDNQVRLPDHAGYLLSVDAETLATNDSDNPFIGLVMYHAIAATCGKSPLVLPIGDGNTGYLARREMASLATHGRIYVFTETDVKKGEKVYYRHTLADNAAVPQTQALGALSNTDDLTTQEIVGARWWTTQAANGLAVIMLTGAHQ